MAKEMKYRDRCLIAFCFRGCNKVYAHISCKGMQIGAILPARSVMFHEVKTQNLLHQSRLHDIAYKL